MWNKLPNGGIEREIKRHLEQQGFRKGSYSLTDIELIAIERPGWKQIFEFLLESTNEEGNTISQRGIAFDDHRVGSKIQLFSTDEEFDAVFEEWGAGMIHRRVSEHTFEPEALLKGVLIISMIALSIVLAWKYWGPRAQNENVRTETPSPPSGEMHH